MTNGTPRTQSATTTAATRAKSCRLLLLGGRTAAGRQDRSTPTQRQHSRNMRYGGVTDDRLRQKQLAAALRGLATRTYKMYPTTAAVRQGCTRSVVLSSCCLVHVIRDAGKISDAKHYPWYLRKNTASVDSDVSMVW